MEPDPDNAGEGKWADFAKNIAPAPDYRRREYFYAFRLVYDGKQRMVLKKMSERKGKKGAPYGDPLRKLTLGGLFVAVSILLSGVHFPMGPTKVYPFQHTVNVLAGAILGPWWAAGAAFVTSLIRNMTGMGTIFAFPGSIPGAVAAGLAYRFVQKPWAGVAESLGTGPIGAGLSALILGPAMGRSVGYWALQGAFLVSSIPGAFFGVGLLYVLQRSPLRRLLTRW